MICIDNIVTPAMCLLVCLHEGNYISMMKLLNPKSCKTLISLLMMRPWYKRRGDELINEIDDAVVRKKA